MNSTVLIAIIAVCIIAIVAAALVLLTPYLGGGARQQARNLVAAQRGENVRGGIGKGTRPVTMEGFQGKVADSRLTLEKQLKYAQWKISPLVFRLMTALISAVTFYLATFKFNFFFQLLSLLVGPILMTSLLTNFVQRRFKAFDAHYPQFLHSLVGLLKTGMNPLQGLDAAAQGLDDGSLVKSEVMLMMERLRFGVTSHSGLWIRRYWRKFIEAFMGCASNAN